MHRAAAQEKFCDIARSGNRRNADIALAKYRERFGTIGLFENRVYPGIAEVLDALRADGHILHIATSKPTAYAVRIADYFGLAKFFHSIHGSELDGTRSDKTSLILHILAHEDILADAALMVGDREHDMIGARQNRMPGIGVLWGYGTKNELETAGALTCITSPWELRRVVELRDSMPG